MEIGRMILSSKTTYKINGKNCKKCYIISDNKESEIVETGKEFIANDIYVKIQNKKVIDNYGIVGIFDNDIKIFHHLMTFNWLSHKNLLKITPFCSDKYFNQRIIYSNPVFVIDPENSTDHDDGFSLSENDDNYFLDIHIADPTAFIDINHINFLDFMNELHKRLNTCYIHNIINLLPKNLIELSSLHNSNKPAITFKFIINKSNHNISFSHQLSILSNIHNFTYDNFVFDLSLYSNLFNIIKSSLNINISLDNSNFINKFIEIIMILTNHFLPNIFISNNKFFICRSQPPFSSNLIINHKFSNLLNYSANYIYTNSDSNHFNLNITNYSHITSPMRRFIDLLNHFIIHNENIHPFINSLDFTIINHNYKKYKRLSSAFNLLQFINYNNHHNSFDAIILDKFNDNFIIGLFNQFNNQNYIINTQLPLDNYSIHQTFNNISIFFNPHKFINSNFPFFISL
jgi:hypothetical protein